MKRSAAGVWKKKNEIHAYDRPLGARDIIGEKTLQNSTLKRSGTKVLSFTERAHAVQPPNDLARRHYNIDITILTLFLFRIKIRGRTYNNNNNN